VSELVEASSVKKYPQRSLHSKPILVTHCFLVLARRLKVENVASRSNFARFQIYPFTCMRSATVTSYSVIETDGLTDSAL